MNLVLLAYVATAGAAALAWAMARRRPDHRPIAWLLTLYLLANLGRRALRELIIAPARDAIRAQGLDPAAISFTGWERVAVDIDGALFISWPAGVAALAIWVFTKRRPWGVLIAYAAAMAFMVATYPRGADLQRLYLAVELAALCASLGCLLVWFRSREPLTLKALATGIIVSVELAMVTGGPYRGNIFLTWQRAQQILIVMFMALIAVHAASIWRSRDST
ncbi:hypothetical protein WMF39_08530 [Sorangium sp. So ce1504]|uniref:hypothetical protein n=1 Tax=Sorangium sp. So ce1504 TaxID=3133337 RepID=UPI003F5F4F06